MPPFRTSAPRPVLYAALALALTLAAPLSAPAAVTFTMEEAVNQALRVNPGVESARHSLDAAESGRKAARAGFGPSIGLNYGATLYDKERPARNAKKEYSYGVTVSQPLFTGFNLLNAYQKAELQEDEKELELENSRLALVGQVQARFLEYLKAQENIRSTRRSLERSRAQLALARASYEVGARPRLDVLQAELDVSRNEAVLIQCENSRDICRAQLNTLLDLKVDADTDYVGDLKTVPFRGTLDACLERAFRLRPDLRLAQLAVDIARRDQGMARSAFFPQLAANFKWQSEGDTPRAAGSRYAGSDYSQWQAGLTASWSIFESGRDYYSARKEGSNIAALEARLRGTFNDSAYEIKSCLSSVQDTLRMIEVARRAVASAQESYADARMRYELQLGTNLDLLTAQSDLAEAELSLISAQTDYLTALSSLYVAMGEINPGLESGGRRAG